MNKKNTQEKMIGTNCDCLMAHAHSEQELWTFVERHNIVDIENYDENVVNYLLFVCVCVNRNFLYKFPVLSLFCLKS